MVKKVLVVLISIASIFIALSQGRYAVAALNIGSEKLHHFSELHSKYMVFPSIYELRVKMLSESDATLFRTYSEVITPYLWAVFIASIILVITIISILISIFKNNLEGDMKCRNLKQE